MMQALVSPKEGQAIIPARLAALVLLITPALWVVDQTTTPAQAAATTPARVAATIPAQAAATIPAQAAASIKAQAAATTPARVATTIKAQAAATTLVLLAARIRRLQSQARRYVQDRSGMALVSIVV